MKHMHTRVSWSALGRWENCGMQEKLTRQHKRSDIQDGRVFLPGTLTDLSMRSWLEQDNPIPGTLADFSDMHFEAVTGPEGERPIKWRKNPEEDKAAVRATVREALTRLDPWLCEHVLPYGYQPEARGVGVVGIPDSAGVSHRVELFFAADILVQADNGKYRLFDLKTTRDPAYVRGKTLGQLTFYKIALAAHLGIPLSEIEYLAFVTPLTPELEVVTSPSADDLRVMVSRITQYVQGIWEEKFDPKAEADSDCTYRCDVRLSCPLFAVPRGANGKVSLAETIKRRKGLNG